LGVFKDKRKAAAAAFQTFAKQLLAALETRVLGEGEPLTF
jgi:hypothetical protein